MSQALCLILLLTLNPVSGNCQPKDAVIVTATAYNLSGHTTSGPKTSQIKGGCIALSRSLAKDLGLYRGPGQYDYRFGTIIEVAGCGHFVFADLMPAKWRGYRVDIYHPTLRQCRVFGVKRAGIKVVK